MNKLLKILNILIPLVFLIILPFTNIGANFVYIMSLTMIIGWIFPYISLLLTGVSLLSNTHKKKALTLNIINILLTLIIIFLIIKIYENTFIIILIEYIIITIISIINSIYLYKDLTKELKKETKEINKLKKENNGIIK